MKKTITRIVPILRHVQGATVTKRTKMMIVPIPHVRAADAGVTKVKARAVGSATLRVTPKPHVAAGKIVASLKIIPEGFPTAFWN